MKLSSAIALVVLGLSPALNAQTLKKAPTSETSELSTLAMADVSKPTELTDVENKKLLYTTYFYTAGEAIVHGYEKDTGVRIVPLQENRTVWQGTVGDGQTVNVPTGQGVFAFLSDKKASILVGTPTSCTAVGYYLRDQNGTFKASRFLTQLPSCAFADENRVIVWAWKDTKIRVSDTSSDSLLSETTVKAGEYLEIPYSKQNHVLDITASGPDISVQVYYDQGFHVPSSDGRVAGKIFRTYVGRTTEGHNDLNLMNYGRTTKATVRDLKTREVIWTGSLESSAVHSIRLSGKYVEVTAEDEISVLVAPYNFQGYAEHHFAGGQEGTGIETSFMTTTSDQLWLFSYFDNNPVKIMNAKDEVLWEGTLGAGNAQGYFPGAGVYKVKSTQGISVMGGSAACGAEYSPAGGLFRIDEELFKVATLIIEARKQEAQKNGQTLSKDQLNGPLTPAELDRAADYVQENTGNKMSPAAVESRMKSMQVY